MHGFCGADTDENSQNLSTGGSLGHGRIKAVAALFDGGEVETRGIRDGLKKFWIAGIVIGPVGWPYAV